MVPDDIRSEIQQLEHRLRFRVGPKQIRDETANGVGNLQRFRPIQLTTESNVTHFDGVVETHFRRTSGRAAGGLWTGRATGG